MVPGSSRSRAADHVYHLSDYLTVSVVVFQGAPGNRGFPGQDGLAGPKVTISMTACSMCSPVNSLQ